MLDIPDLHTLFLGYLAAASEVEGDARAAWQLRIQHLEEAIRVCEGAIKAQDDTEDCAALLSALTDSEQSEDAAYAADAALDAVAVLRKALANAVDNMEHEHSEETTAGTCATCRAIRVSVNALSNTSALAVQRKREIEKQTCEAIWEAVKDMWGASPMQFRAAILGEKENN